MGYVGEFVVDDMSSQIQMFIQHHVHPRADPLEGLYHLKHSSLDVLLKNKLMYDNT